MNEEQDHLERFMFLYVIIFMFKREYKIGLSLAQKIMK